jgi:hypothetical protein
MLVLFFLLQLPGYDINNFSAVVKAAILTNCMGQYRLMAMAT